MNIQIEYGNHRGQAIIKLMFGYDAALVARVRQLPQARWSRTMHCWYIPNTPQSTDALAKIDITVPTTERVTSPAIVKKESTTISHLEKYEQWITRFSNYLKERRYSERTIEHYAERLHIFFGYCRKDVLEITNDDVADFNQHYILAKKLSATYQTQFVSAIKLFYEKIPRKRLDIALLERPRRGKALPNVLPKEDVASIIGATANLKHRAMLSLIYSCGLRRNELIGMKISDIDSRRNLITVRHAKGDRDRVLPLSPKILEMLREYFKLYRPVTWLFEGEEPNTPYAESSLHHVFAAAKHKAGITTHFTLHSLRHCFATHLLESGTNLRYIQVLLGHKHSRTTEIYTHVSTKNIQQIKSPFDDLEL